MKAWKHHDDKILSTLATDMLDRHIFKVEVSEEPIEEAKIAEIADAIAAKMNITSEEAQHYLMSINTIQKDMYSVDGRNQRYFKSFRIAKCSITF